VTDAVADGSDSQIEPDTGPLACEQAPPTPLPYETLSGYSTGEDFALNSQGDYYSNEAGDLIVIKAGQKKMQLFLPNIGTTAGMAFLPNGDLIVASADSGSLLKITTVGTKASPAGSIQTLLSGLQYPNGLDLDYDGTVFVAEQDGQRLRAVNSKTGEWTIVADNLCNANGGELRRRLLARVRRQLRLRPRLRHRPAPRRQLGHAVRHWQRRAGRRQLARRGRPQLVRRAGRRRPVRQHLSRRRQVRRDHGRPRLRAGQGCRAAAPGRLRRQALGRPV
jgi:hypothetical protein